MDPADPQGPARGEDAERMRERLVKVSAWIAAAHAGDAPVSIAALCRAAVVRLGVDGASVTAVSGPVAREPVFASDEVSARLEEFQFTTGEGPGADDFRLGSPMLIPELDSVAVRWPGFVSAAVAAGARAMFSFPLQAGAIQGGVLSLYRARPGPLGAEELADALVFADIALQLLLDVSSGIIGSPGYQPLDGGTRATTTARSPHWPGTSSTGPQTSSLTARPRPGRHRTTSRGIRRGLGQHLAPVRRGFGCRSAPLWSVLDEFLRRCGLTVLAGTNRHAGLLRGAMRRHLAGCYPGARALRPPRRRGPGCRRSVGACCQMR